MGFPSAAESSRQDANQHLSLTVVQGSAGTATASSVLTMPVCGDPVTGAIYVTNIGTIVVHVNNTGTDPIPVSPPQLGYLLVGGTVTTNSLPSIGQSTFGTHGTTGVSLIGTLVGGTSSGVGTEIFITSLSLSIPSTSGSQDVSIGWGTAGGTFHSGTAALVRGNFLAGGGIQKTFTPAVNSGVNAQLCYFQAGAGTVDIHVTYFITATTL